MKPDELRSLAQKEAETRKSYRYRINVCCSSGCMPFGALKVLSAFKDAVKEFGVEEECHVARTGCIGTCSIAPAVLVEPGDYLYQNVTPDRVREIVKEHIVNGRPVKSMLYGNEAYFKKQLRIVLRNAGKI
ncbi:MAG: (2Fe-2S) ferredoxin domain-containing protein, partial [Thermoproteota archaeon]